VKILIENFIENCNPDLTILMDADPEKTLLRSGEGVKFEDKKMEWHKKSRAAYLELAHQQSDRIKIVNAEREYYPKHVDIINCINENLGLNLVALSADEVAKIVADF
jgi:dTMP kinase